MWCQILGYSEWLVLEQQAHSEQLALFAVHCWQHGAVGRPNTPATVLSKVSHVAWRHRRDRGYTVGRHTGHVMAMRGMQRLSPGPRAKAPTSIHDRVLWKAAVMGFFYLLRSSEYLKTRSGCSSFIIIVITTQRGAPANNEAEAHQAEIRLRGSKTDQEGRTSAELSSVPQRPGSALYEPFGRWQKTREIYSYSQGSPSAPTARTKSSLQPP